MSRIYEKLQDNVETTNDQFEALKQYCRDVFSKKARLTGKPPAFISLRSIHSSATTGNELDYQREVIGNGLQLVRVADTLNILLDKYNARADYDTKEWVYKTMAQDMQAFNKYMKDANRIRSRLRASDLSRSFNDETYKMYIDRLIEPHHQIGKHEETLSSYDLSPQQLLERIFHARMDAAKISLRTVQSHAWHISTVASEAQDLKSRQEKGELRRDTLTMGQIEASRVFCDKALPVVEKMLKKVNGFVDLLGESDIGGRTESGVKRLPLRAFQPLSIRDLPQLPLAFNRKLVP